MTTWAEFEASAPEIANTGWRLLDRDGTGQALLATVSGDAAPRIHPIYLAVVDGRLYAFILRSRKRSDLERDGRFALHAHQDPARPSEFLLRGRAQLVRNGAVRDSVAAGWSFDTDESYELFEFSLEDALLGRRDDAEEWPPRYSSWRSG